MKDATNPSIDTETPLLRSLGTELDTTSGSLLHLWPDLLKRIGVTSGFMPAALYLSNVTLQFLPLLIAAWIGPLPLIASEGGHRIPFLLDFSALTSFLVAYPCVFILLLTDQRALSDALNQVQSGGALNISPSESAKLAERWGRRFWFINLIAQIFGLLLGGVLSYFNFQTFSEVSLGHWLADNGRLTPAGYLYLAWIFPGSVIFLLYVVRNISIAFLLRDVVAHCRLHVLPLHPDRAGGLQPVGRLGLRNQYALTAIGLNFVAALAVAHVFLDGYISKSLFVLLIGLFVVYVVVSPVIFMAPLMPFRDEMLKRKTELQANVARRLLSELDQLYSRLSSGEIRAEDQGLVERLRSIAAVIDEMPVWPFDATTLRKFFTAMILPIVSTFSFPASRILYEYFSR